MGTFRKMKGLSKSLPAATGLKLNLAKADALLTAERGSGPLMKSAKEVASSLALLKQAAQLVESGTFFSAGGLQAEAVKAKLTVLNAYADERRWDQQRAMRQKVKDGALKAAEAAQMDAAHWGKVSDLCWKVKEYIDNPKDGDALYRSAAERSDFQKSLQKATANPFVMHTSKPTPAFRSYPGAQARLAQRGPNLNVTPKEEKYLHGLYENMPSPKLQINDGNFNEPDDVVKGLGFGPRDERIWSQKVRVWTNTARTVMDLRKALYASLSLEKAMNGKVRSELARRTMMLFKEQRRQAGDFVVKSITFVDGKPVMMSKAMGQAGGRQSDRGKQAAPKGGRGGNGYEEDEGPERVSTHPGGKGDEAAQPKPAMMDGYEDGEMEGDENGDGDLSMREQHNASPELDTAALEDEPQDEGNITAELEKLHKQLHELHAHLEHTPGEIHLHNELVAKMREVYAKPTPEGLRDVRHDLHHFAQMVQGPEEGVEPPEDPNGTPQGKEPPAFGDGDGDGDGDFGQEGGDDVPAKPGGPPGKGPPDEGGDGDGPPKKGKPFGKSTRWGSRDFDPGRFFFIIEEGALIDLDDLVKGAGHAYIRRVPTGKSKPKYRYFYSVDSKHHDEDVAVGEKVRIKHGDQEGHYEVTKVVGGKVHVRHDETGHMQVLDKKHLHDVFAREHAGKIVPKYRELKRIARLAMQYGTKKQKLIAIRNVDAFTKRYDLPPFKLESPAEHKQAAAAAAKGVAKKMHDSWASANARLAASFTDGSSLEERKRFRKRAQSLLDGLREHVRNVAKEGTAGEQALTKAVVASVDSQSVKRLLEKDFADNFSEAGAKPKIDTKPLSPTTWNKQPDGSFVFGDAKLHKVGKDWVLTTPKGDTKLGKKASFTHAERELVRQTQADVDAAKKAVEKKKAERPKRAKTRIKLEWKKNPGTPVQAPLTYNDEYTISHRRGEHNVTAAGPPRKHIGTYNTAEAAIEAAEKHAARPKKKTVVKDPFAPSAVQLRVQERQRQKDIEEADKMAAHFAEQAKAAKERQATAKGMVDALKGAAKEQGAQVMSGTQRDKTGLVVVDNDGDRWFMPFDDLGLPQPARGMTTKLRNALLLAANAHAKKVIQDRRSKMRADAASGRSGPKGKKQPTKKPAGTPSKPTKGAQLRHKEVGEHVWGARKDFAGLREKAKAGALTPSDLEGVSFSDAARLVTKKNLFPAPSVDQLKAKGMTAGAAHMTLAMHSLIGAKPPDSAEGRRLYTQAMRVMQGGLDKMKTVDDFESFRHEIHDQVSNAGRTVISNDEIKSMGLNPDDYSTTDALRDREAHPDNVFIQTEHQYRGGSSRTVHYRIDKAKRSAVQAAWLTMGTRFLQQLSIGKPTKYAASARATANLINIHETYDGSAPRGGKQWSTAMRAAKKFDDDPSGWKAVEEGTAAKKGGKREPGKGTGRVSIVQKVSGKPIRKGGTSIPSGASGERMSKTFGFSNLDHGNWMTDADREHHLHHAETAFHDLSDILSVTPDTISLKGRLAVHFGARGAGGKGAGSAHYEPGAKVMNITKFAGAGSVAHEWGHFLDNVMADHHIQDTGSAAGQFLTDAHAQVSRGDEKAQRLGAAAKKLMHAIQYGDPAQADKREAAHRVRRLELKARIAVDGDLRQAFNTANRAAGEARRAGKSTAEVSKLRDESERKRNIYNAAIEEHNAHVSVNPRGSHYMQDATALDGSTKKAYYADNPELFARAFESFIEDKLKDKGRQNTYLVDGTQERYDLDRSSPIADANGKIQPAQPYPQGQERKLINKAVGELLAIIREDGHLKKALDWVDDLRKAEEALAHSRSRAAA
jgi:hypothetical protein